MNLPTNVIILPSGISLLDEAIRVADHYAKLTKSEYIVRLTDEGSFIIILDESDDHERPETLYYTKKEGVAS